MRCWREKRENNRGDKMLTAGIDVGSRTTKAVILKDNMWFNWSLMATGASAPRRAEEVLNQALHDKGLSIEDLDYIIATGYGRSHVPFAHDEITEITCHAVGAYSEFEKTRTIIDIGGQDSKVIRLDDQGHVEDFLMNDKCAAGTGRFLEVMAENLEVNLEDIGQLSLQSRQAAPVSSTCTVFAESEVISLVAKGKSKEEILKGLHLAIIKRLAGMAYRVGVKNEVTLTGGVCLNKGICQLLEARMSMSINIPERPQFVGAYGAARLARLKLEE